MRNTDGDGGRAGGRFFWALLAATVLALPVAFGWPAQAAAQERVLVSNVGQPDGTVGLGYSIFAFGSNLIDNAQRFTTGRIVRATG